MKLSMWMIVDKLQKYNPKYDIRDGDARISGVRFFSGEEMEFDWSYVYLGLDAEVFSESRPSESAVLVNRRDIIILENSNISTILNDIMAIFDYYNIWETTLWEESSYKSFQRIIDLGDSVLKNPIILSDSEGSVLAMSSAFRDEDINEYWVETRNANHVPAVILGSPKQAQGGEIVRSWTNEPAQYLMPDGTNTIGVFLEADGENVAAFGLWEHRNPISPGDVWLVKTMCTVLTSMIGEKKRGGELRSGSAIIGDLLGGTEIDGDLLRKLELKCSSPWQLIVIDNPFRSDIFYARSIVGELREHTTPCVPLIYGDKAVALVSAENARLLLNSILGAREKQYYIAGLSLPFDDLRNTAVRYEQTLFTLERADEKPGMYYAEDCGFEYLLSLIGEKNKRQGLAHPALAQLRRYDTDKQTDLYNTLFHYLRNERSILLGSQALHIHRNSFMYRLRRINELVQIDLDDPETRAYLLFSYMLENS